MIVRRITGLIAFLAAAALAAQAAQWEPLFDGKTLKGWTTMGDPQWSVSDGVISVHGTGKEMGWLLTDKSYSDFTLRLRFQWKGGNSGIQFRSRVENGKVIGYQANLDFSRPTATGSLVEENGRGLIEETELQADAIKREGWNEYEVTAVGSRIQIYINGYKALDVDDPDGPKEGVIALQMAPGEGAALDFADLRVMELPANAEWVSMFNGKDLTGWRPLGDCYWDVLHGTLIGQSRGGQYGWLVSDREYKDFVFSTRFWMPIGNSGIQFRSQVKGAMVNGFQADMASDTDWISGHLYDQGGRGVLDKPTQDFTKIINWKGWNTYEVTAIGPDITFYINGIKSIEASYPDSDKAGIIAFQIHMGMKMLTEWEDIRILPLDE
ncbi:MAG: DUF1080 domain-containing protein [bacterium]|nr:DUF1080 domain-containing protein [bacterium]